LPANFIGGFSAYIWLFKDQLFEAHCLIARRSN